MNIVTERPILMSAPMVQAILEGRKTVTRRVIKPQPDMVHEGGPYYKHPSDAERHDLISCPYGQVGDRLWVRETWSLAWTPAQGAGILYLADNERRFEDAKQITAPFGAWHNLYRLPPPSYCDNQNPRKVRPSIFMPRWASRLTLEITDIRVERVQDITEEDAIAEGVAPDYVLMSWNCIGPDRPKDFRQSFKALWNSLNEKRGFSWDQNCWVWVIGFKKIEQESA